MRRRARKQQATAQQRGAHEPTDAREALERRWFRQIEQRPELAEHVTGTGLRSEPFHRWLPYKQAFSPQLIRSFLREMLSNVSDGPIFDPFAGTGTTIVECVARGCPALGVEATPALAYIARAKGARSFPTLPNLDNCQTIEQLADQLTDPVHRAGLLCAHAAGHTTDGHPIADAPPIRLRLANILKQIRADLAHPLNAPVDVRVGDARVLADIPDNSVAAALTSPPYLSRHDYTRITRPIEQLSERWFPARDESGARERQIRAHPKAYEQSWTIPPHAATAEAIAALQAREEPKLSGIVRSYFEDMHRALAALLRTLRSNAPVWFVVGGARLKGVYVPADLILAEHARALGFTVGSIMVARRLIPTGRKLGNLSDVSPRESILELRA